MVDDEVLAWANARPDYEVTPMRAPDGTLAPHYRDELERHGADFDALMGDARFAETIESELAAELVANEPLSHLARLAPDDAVGEVFLRWLGFVNADLQPWTTGGAIHFRPHWARVLMLALVLGSGRGLPAADLRALAMAAVFHDSRRKDPYLDTGHGARAAAYYLSFCQETAAGAQRHTPAGRAIAFDPRTYLAVCWHDRDDDEGLAAIGGLLAAGVLPEAEAAGLPSAAPDGAVAGFADVYRILKDADALDRVRLGSGDLDTRFLRTPESHGLISFAWELFDASCARMM